MEKTEKERIRNNDKQKENRAVGKKGNIVKGKNKESQTKGKERKWNKRRKQGNRKKEL